MEDLEIFDNPKPLIIPGFQKQEQVVQRMNVYPPLGMSVKEWYDQFADNFFFALKNNRPFPVFRSSHGEISFALGKIEVPKGDLKVILRFYLSRFYRIVKHQSVFYSGTPNYGYESYKQWKLPRLRKSFSEYLRWISKNGVLAMYFADRDAFPIVLQKEYLEWLNSAGIFLNAENYAHIYFVYGLFNGLRRDEIYQDHKILIVNSNESTSRNNAIKNNLLKMGASDVRYLPISRTQSMEDNVAPPVDFEPDLVLVGAGVGAAKVIYQLRELNCPIIDVGFVLDTLADPNFLSQRIYCVNDNIWESYFPTGIPPYAKKFVL